jgi:hypothetical protein
MEQVEERERAVGHATQHFERIAMLDPHIGDRRTRAVVAIEMGQDLRIACRPSYNCSYDWILDAGEGARHRWLMARDDQVKVVAYSYLDLTGKIVRPVSKNIWLRPSVPNSAWVKVNHDTDDVILCVGYNAGGHAHVIYAGNLYTVAPSELETTIVTPSSVPLV